MKILRAAQMALVVCLLGSAAHAADLKIGLSAAPTSMDPQFYVLGPNSAMARNVFDGLINQDAKQQLQPGLALSWKTVDETTWDFKLRPNVKFHDGSDFTAADVVASIKRIPLASQKSPSSFATYVKDIVDVTAVDPMTVRIKTAAPLPLLPSNLSRIAILPAKFGNTPTEEFNAGRAVVGTGPFRFASWSRDDNVVLQRFDGYWGGQAAWDKVTFRIITSNGARVAALLAGDVDMIENIPTTDTRNLQASDKLRVVSVASNRVMYLHMDQGRDVSPFAVGPDGKNPLRKQEVRHAMSMAINREGLVDRVMDGQGAPAGQLVPDGYFGMSPNLPVEKYDPVAAKALLATAGYPNGFKLTFHASNDRYPNDSNVAQALGQMFTRIGITTAIETMPGSVYFTKASAQEFSLIMGGAAVETGEASGVLGPLLETFSDKAGQGNRGRYSSAAFDNALVTARNTLDDAKREALLRSAMETGIKDLGVIPLFFLANTWGLKKNLSYAGRSDGYTLAVDVRLAN